MTDLYTLGLEVRSDGVVVASNRLNQLAKDGKNAEDSTKRLSTATSSLVNYMKAAAAALGAYKLYEMAKEAALLAARYQTLGVVMNTVGATAGYTNAQMAAFEKTLQKQGIAMIESRQVLTQMAQAHLDLAKSSELARVAQDAATIGGINSSEAFERMVAGIQKGETEILKTIGINVNFEQSYVKMAATLGKSRDALSETEKSTARMNAVLERGKDIAGVYEAAMGTAGKQLTSMKRYMDNLKVTLGSVFNDALIVAVQAFTGGLKEANTEAEKLAEQNKLAESGRKMVEVMAVLADAANFVFKIMQTAGTTIAATASRAVFAFEAMAAATKGNFSEARSSIAAMSSTTDEWADNIGKVWSNMTKYQDAAAKMYGDRGAAKAKEDAAKKELEAKQMAAGATAKQIQADDELAMLVKKNREQWAGIVVEQLESVGAYSQSAAKQIELNKLTDDYKTMLNAAGKSKEAAAALASQELLDQQRLTAAKRKELDMSTDHEKVMLNIESAKLAAKGYSQDAIYLENGYKQALLDEQVLQNQITTEINPRRKTQMQEQLEAQQEVNRLVKEEVEQRQKVADTSSKQKKDAIDEYNQSITITRTRDEQYANDKYVTSMQGRFDAGVNYIPGLTEWVENQAKERIYAYEKEKAEAELIEQQKALVEAISAAAEDLSSAATSLANTGRSLAEALRAASRSILSAQVDIAGGTTSTLTPEQKYLMAKQLFLNTASQAQSTGDSELFSQLPELAKKMLEASMGYSTSSSVYASDYNTVQAILAESATMADSYADTAETIATLLEQQTLILTAIQTALETGGDTASLLTSLNTTNGQITTAVNGVNTSVGAVTTATNAVNTSVGSNTTVTTSGTSTLSGYLSNVQSYTSNTSSYTNSTQTALNNSLLNSQNKGRVQRVVTQFTGTTVNGAAQYEDLYTYYRNGGIANDPTGRSIFGEAGPEAAVPLPDGRTIPVTLNRSAADSYASKELVAEIQQLRAELRRQAAEQVKWTQKTARIIDKWDGDGMPAVAV